MFITIKEICPQLDRAQFLELFNGTPFHWTGDKFKARTGPWECTLNVAIPKGQGPRIKKLTALSDILHEGEQWRGWNLYVINDKRIAGFSYTDGARGKDLCPAPSKGNPQGSMIRSPEGGRAYLQTTLEDFIDRLNGDPLRLVKGLLRDSDKIEKDLSKAKIQIDTLTIDPNPEYSFQPTIMRDHAFLPVQAWGEKTPPFIFIIYWDGYDWRAFLPKEGNTWHPKNPGPLDYQKVLDAVQARFQL